MIRIFVTAFALAALCATPGLAQDHHGDHGDNHADPHQGETVEVTRAEVITTALAAGGALVTAEVNGMVCDFCAIAMTRTFGRRDEVSAVHVDLDTKTLQLVIGQGHEMSDETITDLVRRSGYELVSVHRGEAA
jgi:copper chaperone CopZ